jgi:hypothetical protein
MALSPRQAFAEDRAFSRGATMLYAPVRAP